MKIRARHYRTGETIELTCRQGRIEAVGPAGGDGADLTAGWVGPALFDLQINGAIGIAFGSPTLTADGVRRVVARCQAHGIAGLCPTLITGAREALMHGFGVLARACDDDPELARALPCFHLEGPYISPEDGPRGAHPREHVRPPDRDEFQRFQEAAGGRIRLVTLAPEVEGALGFIEWLVGQGVVVAIAHTAARPQQIRDAVRAGARLSTHLGNGSHAVLPRHENYVLEQLADDGLWASIITDGHHLPAALIRCILRVKTPDRLILTCDASTLAGLPPGRYAEWGQELEVQPGGKVIVWGTPFLAGSGVFTDRCLRVVLGHAEVSLPAALDMAGARPRALLGLPRAGLEPGMPADLVLFEHEPGRPFRLAATLVAGRVVAPNPDVPAGV
jgi:N-acetylglucosamine-6-phosphate deacetylase